MTKPLSPGLWTVAIAAFAVTVLLTHWQTNTRIEHKAFLAPPPEHIEYFHFGFRESLADSFWLRWIQDSDVCQTYLKETRQLRKDQDLKKDPLFANQEHKVCDNSWAYKMLDAVTRLAPRFEMAYLAGGSLLAVAIEDYTGATVIFDRGVEHFPTHWPMLYRAAYHFLYDTHDLPKAARLLEAASANGAPPWLRSLAARIYSQSGQYELGIAALESYRPLAAGNKILLEKIDKRIAELKAKMAKEP